MNFQSVFELLQELFTQVDHRILKAAAIEHSNDAHAAVEFILFDVLHSISDPPEAPHTPIDNWGDKRPSNCNLLDTPLPRDNQDAEHPSARGVEIEEQNILLKHPEAFEEENPGPSKLRSVESVYHEDTDHASTVSDISSTCLHEAPADSAVSTLHGRHNPDQQFMDAETELSSSIEHQDIKITFGSHQGSNFASSSIIHEDTVISGYCNHIPRANIQDLNELVAYDADSPICEDNLQDQLCLGANPLEAEKVLASFLLDSASVYEEATDSASEGDIAASVSECEKPEWIGSLENVSVQLAFDSEIVDVEEKSSSTTIDTRSGQICSIELLEDAIRDAKNNKKTLFSAMESVINMMREVELQENRADQAKEEVDRVDLHMLEKVEDLRQILQHAKQANQMHIGEVYGEKAILATEAQEFQSRLRNLSDERNKSLMIIDEMHITLEARLAAAEEVRKAAEQEKLEKEERAQKSLAEVKLEMDIVVQESKRLQQEAEENSKLREFLMDRGRVVDILQGEIAVICQDVKLLKEKFDEHVPLSKSLSSCQTSCILASSGSSVKNLASDQVMEQIESTTTPKRTSPVPSINGPPPKSSPEGKGIRNNRKVLLDDGWDLFDDEVEQWN